MSGDDTEHSGAAVVSRVVPLEFVRQSSSGRTRPAILLCENDDGSTVEVVAKFSAGCFHVSALAFEVLCACVGRDLGLPIPDPFLIELSSDWIATVPSPDMRARIGRSATIAFGSRLATPGFNIWHAGSSLTAAMMPTALKIFAFDAIAQNPDRRPGNPNCLVRGEQLLVFDHELTFNHAGNLGWKPPWALGGLDHMTQPAGRHIFWEQLRGRSLDFSDVERSWWALSDARLDAYVKGLPPEWADARVQEAVDLLRDARQNVDGCTAEMRRVLQ